MTIGVQQPALIQGAESTAELQFFLQGPDLAELDKYAQQVKKRLAEIPGVTDLDSSYEAGKPELRVIVNRDKAADLNVNVSSIANAMRVLVGGDDQVTTIVKATIATMCSYACRRNFAIRRKHSSGSTYHQLPSATLRCPMSPQSSRQPARRRSNGITVSARS